MEFELTCGGGGGGNLSMLTHKLMTIDFATKRQKVHVHMHIHFILIHVLGREHLMLLI